MGLGGKGGRENRMKLENKKSDFAIKEGNEKGEKEERGKGKGPCLFERQSHHHGYE